MRKLTVLVTGASAGVGAATARRFVRDGHRVIAAARRVDRLQAMATELGPELLPLGLDVTDAKAVAALPDSLPESWREVDVLVNNAGLALGMGPAWQASLADWETMIATNVTGLVRLTHALLPGMVERNRGHVVNIGSIAGSYPYSGGHVYGGSKAFVEMFTLNLKADLLGRGVRVTNIEPAMIGGDSEFVSVRFGGDAERVASFYAGTQPLTPEDMAETVAWSVSLPAHVNINRIEVMPLCQGPGPLQTKRAT